MSDFMPRDILPDLWEEILKRHWTYLETEESIQKLEERKKLEGCLKELLCIVRHDRKFFLPETAIVLKNSIRELNDFNVQKAIGAFEAISQYANNLFTKPWRKEFRILKMYSGFFQHEIHSNLIDAEKLFEAMGYRRLSDDTLILDGPICPDQVTNVSRDAMAAYVELQIMKNIYMALNGNNMTTTWLDIFRYREKNIGGISQAVKDLIYATEEKRYRLREKALAGGSGDNYGYIDVQPSPNYAPLPPACQCGGGAGGGGGSIQYQIPQPPRQRIANGPCCAHEMQRSHPDAVFGNMNYSNHNFHHSPAGIGSENISHLPHSRSLEHYSEPASIHQHNMLPHRHSFDHQQQGCTAAGHHQHQSYGQMQRLHHSIQQQHQYYRNAAQNFYESPYDIIDDTSMGGGSTISYAAVAASSGPDIPASNNSNLYNVSGNRYPLPYNISNQLSAYDKIPPHPAFESSSYGPDNHMYAQVSKMPQGYMLSSSGNMMGSGGGYAKPMQSSASDQLIDFEDPPIIPPPPAGQFDPYHQQYQHHDAMKAKRNSKMYESDYSQKRDQNYASNPADMYVYAKPIPKDSRQGHKASAHISKKPPFNSSERVGGGDSTDFSYESANDDFSNIHRQHSPTQFSKNQDGVGSFESWNYVFKNLERSAYSKDLGDREDLLVKSINLDSLNIANDSTTPSQTSSVEKRRPIHNKELENNQTAMPTKQDVSTSPPNNSSSKQQQQQQQQQQQKPQMDNKQKMKSALKQSSAVSNNTKQTTTSNKKSTNFSKANDNKSKANNNDNNNSVINNSVGSGAGRQTKKASSVSLNSTKRSASEGMATSSSANNPASTQIIVTGTNEWSCRFCTFINPDSTRICEICCRTKDNNLNASSSSGSTTQQSVNHTAPTCV